MAKTVYTWGFSSFYDRDNFERFKKGDYWSVYHYPFFDFDGAKFVDVHDFGLLYLGYHAVLKTSAGYHLIGLLPMSWYQVTKLMFEALKYGLDTKYLRISIFRGYCVLRYGSKGKKKKPELLVVTSEKKWREFIKSRTKFLIIYETTNW